MMEYTDIARLIYDSIVNDSNLAYCPGNILSMLFKSFSIVVIICSVGVL